MGFFLALRFLSILPIPGPTEATERQLGRSTAWYPLVGVVLGVLLYGCVFLFVRLWSPLPAAALCLAVWILFTRALHLDGLADTFDGLGAAGGAEQKLAAMKDSRSGVFGVLAVAVIVVGKFAFLSELVGIYRPEGLILVPVLGRWAMLLALFSFPSAVRSGLGFRVRRHCRWPQLAIGTAVALACTILSLGAAGLIALGCAGAAAAIVGLLCLRRLGGLTGDGYGAVCEIGELAALAAVSALIRI